MRSIVIVLTGVTAFLGLSAVRLCAELKPSEHQVILPDGTPAAGVQVRVMQVDKPHKDIMTNDEGRFALTDPAPFRFGPRPGIMVIAPGAAIGVWNTPGDTLELKPAFTIKGSVETPDGKPVSGAKITVVEIGTRTYVSLTGTGDGLPWGPIESNSDGVFSLRGATFNGYKFAPGLRLRAEASIDGRLHTVIAGVVGLGDADFFENPAKETESGFPLVLRPTGDISGQVVNALTGEPLPGAEIRSYSGWRGDRTKAVADADGRFRLTKVPGYQRRRMSVGLAGFVNADIRQIAHGPTLNPDVADLRIPLSPLVTVKGWVRDAFSKTPAMTPLELAARQEFEINGVWQVASGRSGIVKKDGSFTIDAPAGSAVLRMNARHPNGAPYRHSWEVEINPEQKPLGLDIPRKPGLLFELSVPGNPPLSDPIWNQLSPRFGIADSGSLRFARGSNRWFAEAEAWGDEIEVTIVRHLGDGRKIVFPKKTYVAQPDSWPIRIVLDEL